MIQGYGTVKGLEEEWHMLPLHRCVCHWEWVPILHICQGHTPLTSGPPPCAPYFLVFPVETSLTTHWIMKQRLYKCYWDFDRPRKDLRRGDKSVLTIVERDQLWKLVTHALGIQQLMRFMYLYLLEPCLPVFHRILCLLFIYLHSRF